MELECLCPEPWGQPMRRRKFIGLIVAAIAWPLSADAEQMPMIGLLNPLPAPEGMPQLVAGFRQGLAEEGYYEGKNVAIEYHYINFKPELMQQAARDVVQRKVNVIFASTPDAIAAARSVTSTIPTVAVDLESDPVAKGYIKSLARVARARGRTRRTLRRQFVTPVTCPERGQIGTATWEGGRDLTGDAIPQSGHRRDH